MEKTTKPAPKEKPAKAEVAVEDKYAKTLLSNKWVRIGLGVVLAIALLIQLLVWAWNQDHSQSQLGTTTSSLTAAPIQPVVVALPPKTLTLSDCGSGRKFSDIRMAGGGSIVIAPDPSECWTDAVLSVTASGRRKGATVSSDIPVTVQRIYGDPSISPDEYVEGGPLSLPKGGVAEFRFKRHATETVTVLMEPWIE
ncbi:MAG: hypothetical protein AAB691_02220 [Patescibacteria group bacterium]